MTVQRTIYRVVQEALTNMRKHAPHTDATITLRYLAGSVGVRVHNGPSPETDGAGTTDLPGAGLGLVGLRERVDLLGGRLAAGPAEDGGFLVEAELPAGDPA
ncbi:sensor histidine kinase [Plantactinospora sp. GCM10030261]|uniref:sensor histidine kinase n=1 Tax=Plantactinospora sp. GCM10030261 TaxID=3273420 RepID=UPI0036105D1A